MATQRDEAWQWRGDTLNPQELQGRIDENGVLGRDALVAKLIEELQGQKVLLDLAPGATYHDEAGVGLVPCLLSSAPPTFSAGYAWGGFYAAGEEDGGKLYFPVRVSKVRAVLPYGSPEAEALREVAS